MNAQYPRGIEVVGSAVIENGKGEILLTQSPKWHNKWVMTGGHVEPGENIIAAMLREAQEETGLVLEGTDIINFGELINSHDFHRPAHFIYFAVYCKIVKDGEIILDNRELSAYKWVTPQDALKMELAESYDITVRKFIEYRGI